MLLGSRPSSARPRTAASCSRNALLPWLSVMENTEFGLKLQGVPKQQRRELAEKNLALVGEGLPQPTIYQLSGGMQQRVGIARALTRNPAMLLMDEPMAALDALTRETIQELLLDVWQKTQKMFFFITHSVEEPSSSPATLIVMSPRPGRITHRYELDFSKRFLRDARRAAIKSSGLHRMREVVLNIIYGDERAGESSWRPAMRDDTTGRGFHVLRRAAAFELGGRAPGLAVRQALGAAGRTFRPPARSAPRRSPPAPVVALLLLWVVVGNSGLVKPLFLPTPQAVFGKVHQVATEASPARRCSAHADQRRVFGAFALACATAIPIGVLMGVSRVAASSIRRSSSTARCRRWPYLPMVIIWFGIGGFSNLP